MAVIFSLTSLMLAALPMPEWGTTPPNAVDFETVRQLVLRKADAEWPGCRVGTILPYVDETGATVGYLFHFRTDGAPFPEQEQVTRDVLADRERLTMNTDLTKWRSRYSYILASARYDLAPFVCFGYGSSEYYAIGEEAQRRAREVLGDDAALSRIYFIECRAFLEFGNSAGEYVVMSNHFEQTWNSRESFREYVEKGRAWERAQDWYNADEIEQIHRQEWQDAFQRDFTDFAEYYVPNVHRAPFYNWGYGCSPTAGAMVLGYIDRTQSYGRLVDHYWQRYDPVLKGMNYQNPNTQYECAVAMKTDTVNNGGTYMSAIPSGLRNAANGYGNNYSFTVSSVNGTSSNDWAWSTTMSEINNGYAHVWSVTWQAHSLACFGYRTEDKYVYVHNTWWAPAAWWAHSGSGTSQIASPRPVGAEPRKLELVYPRGDTNYNRTGGGEVLQAGDTVSVIWDNYGNPGTGVTIEYSVTGGKSWQLLASGVPDNGLYKWYVSPTLGAQESVRLRLKQYNGTTLTSGDGTISNFTIQREPMPPKFYGPPNGQQIFNPPVVLMVDSLYSGDSLDFRLMYGTDTIMRYRTTDWWCQIPDGVLIYGRCYKWTCRARNRFGWGNFGTQWSFWVRFTGVSEEKPARAESGLRVTGVNSLEGEAVFQVSRPAAGVRLVVYNALGSVVREITADQPRVVWDLRDQSGVKQSAGFYFAQLVGAAGTPTAKFVLVD